MSDETETLQVTIQVSPYDAATGRVLGTLTLPPSGLPLQTVPLYLGVLDSATQYVDPASGEARERPLLDLTVDTTTIRADGSDVATISGIPPGTVVYSPLGRHVIDDGVLEYTTVYPGDHRFVIDAFPAQRQEVTIHAN
ncbi:hypothetical protein [Azospirillum canadense]|uniref:hypothetical protein n=1 Tax=Azospirillum canadense TaxID=403962 RepID=UPI002227C73D|nr:hypothetical protein [Azospirillum canadense]MCW2242274.1 hypothetical protein [Azospirillum canadense]